MPLQTFHVQQYEMGILVRDYKTNDVYLEDGELKITQGDSIVTLQTSSVQEIILTK